MKAGSFQQFGLWSVLKLNAFKCLNVMNLQALYFELFELSVK